MEKASSRACLFMPRPDEDSLGIRMSKAGFIDLENGWTGNTALAVHVFDGGEGSYAFEKTVEISPDTSAGAALDGVEDFCLGLPLRVLNFRILGLPFSDRQKLKGTIPFELDGLILGGSETIVFDSVLLGESDSGFDVLAVYIEKKSLRDILGKLAAMGIDPRVVTSVDVRHALDGGRDGLGSHLIDPDLLSAEERRDTAAKELAAPAFNLRTGPFAYMRDEETLRKRFTTTVVLSLLLALLINADLAFRLISAKKESGALKKEVRTIYSGLFPDEKKITDEVYQIKSHMKELREKEDLLTGVSPLRLIKDLSQRKMPGVRLDELSVDKDLITMKGEAVAMDRLDELKTRLADFLSDVSISDIKTSPDGKLRFTAVARGYKQGPGT